jgi:hypothetical protein
MRAIATRWSIFPETRGVGIDIDPNPVRFARPSGGSPLVRKSIPAKMPWCCFSPVTPGTLRSRVPQPAGDYLLFRSGCHASPVQSISDGAKKEKTGSMTILDVQK